MSLRRFFATLFLLLVAAFTLLMLTKVVPYLSFEPEIDFLTTKTDRVLARQDFQFSFYIHIVSSLWVMGIGISQFIPSFVKKYPRLHQSLGKIYVFSILFLAAPSGLGLAIYANGGLPAKVGFSLQCVVWWLTTWAAWREIQKKRWQTHIEWMMRSYAVTLAAMSLRVGSYALVYFFHTKPIETYLTVAWLSWVGNLAIVEGLIYAGMSERLLKMLQK
ncbi:DUF2306 domain-containing protein [Runella salmonicolor]|uniref:DUF2306 domain-containing protein n=1 Tax=Runella salmonicolor TaxID=2950278 RepID=A0ABT1FV28_9BACT|nr:DUF2306 domain-containing protein [Runella salmonicolor]MCP1385522.1 DUF2306 domain-containing protein [Runella salmonicolor]